MAEEKELTIELMKHSDEKKTSVLMGGDPANPSWAEYLDEYRENFQPHVKLIRKCIEDNGLLRETGEGMQRQGISFRFSDGEHWAFTWRAWGDLMQAIVNKREGYMAYYM